VELGPTPTRGERGGNMFRKQHWYIVDQDGGEAREIWLGALIFSGSVDQLGAGERAGWYGAASCRAFLCALCSVPASSHRSGAALGQVHGRIIYSSQKYNRRHLGIE
jgi:hypothetical protein